MLRTILNIFSSEISTFCVLRNIKVKGMKYYGRQELEMKRPYLLQFDPNNKYSGDKTAAKVVVVMVSQFNGTSTPNGSYSAKTGDNDCNFTSSRYSISTALCERNSQSGQI